jgi:hypothetical protein
MVQLKDNLMDWVKKEGVFNQGKAKLLGILNLVKVAEEVYGDEIAGEA